MAACQAVDQGSIPCGRIFSTFSTFKKGGAKFKNKINGFIILISLVLAPSFLKVEKVETDIS